MLLFVGLTPSLELIMREHESGCPRQMFWDAGEYECPCTCNEEETMNKDTISYLRCWPFPEWHRLLDLHASARYRTVCSRRPNNDVEVAILTQPSNWLPPTPYCSECAALEGVAMSESGQSWKQYAYDDVVAERNAARDILGEARTALRYAGIFICDNNDGKYQRHTHTKNGMICSLCNQLIIRGHCQKPKEKPKDPV